MVQFLPPPRGEGGALVSAASQQDGVGGVTHELNAD